MKVYVTQTDGFVSAIYLSPRQGTVEVQGALPPRPIAEDDTEPRLMLVDGQLVWQVGKTQEEISALRAQAYRDRVDPITCEIQRLRDDYYTPQSEIDDAIERRDAEVVRIKAEFPYAE